MDRHSIRTTARSPSMGQVVERRRRFGASLGIVGLGTDTYGSLIQPASANGLVALRPTQGLIPNTGVMPLMNLQDTPGPMARTVEDVAAILELLVDKSQVGKGSQSYTSQLKSTGLQGLSLGF